MPSKGRDIDPGRLFGADAAAGTAYAGIGARDAPAEMLALIERAAFALARGGWLCRTGRSPGCDQAFEAGAARGGGGVEVFLPWPEFERDACNPLLRDTHVRLSRPSADAYALAARHHPQWSRVPSGARALLARDGHQVLGAALDAPVRMVLCWTADGAVDRVTPRTGGTGQALRIARAHDIPIFNLARADHRRRVLE